MLFRWWRPELKDPVIPHAKLDMTKCVGISMVHVTSPQNDHGRSRWVGLSGTLTGYTHVAPKEQIYESGPESLGGISSEESDGTDVIEPDDDTLPQIPAAEREIEGDFEYGLWFTLTKSLTSVVFPLPAVLWKISVLLTVSHMLECSVRSGTSISRKAGFLETFVLHLALAANETGQIDLSACSRNVCTHSFV
jgi:hypothetical protein